MVTVGSPSLLDAFGQIFIATYNKPQAVSPEIFIKSLFAL
jgi:hypothetical protein